MFRSGLLLSAILFFSGCANYTGGQPPMADIHLHFNWNQQEVTTAEEAINALRENNVVMAVVAGVPSADAIKLRKAGGNWIYPIFSPYITGLSRNNWFRDEKVLTEARQGLAVGHYFGVGEVHLVSGLGPRRDNAIFQGLLALAAEYDVPFMLHTETSSYKYVLPLCQQHTSVRFLWAHAGGVLPASHSEALLAACPNMWIELSARDPWHYGGLVNQDGSLLKDWKDLFLRYPDRFMTGTDPVWNAHQVYRWYEADEGWKHYTQLNKFHRNWMEQLPEEVEQKIRLLNAIRLFRAESR